MSSEFAQHMTPATGPEMAEAEKPAISVDNVSKHYLMFDRPDDRLKQMIVPRLQRAIGLEPKRYFRDFAAVSHVSFTVGRGETVGIIGRNGSGKSTLLQMVCGTLTPSTGSIAVNGRIAALLELGAGFNPEFTGRENVFMNAAILGLRHEEIEARFDDIARFADIGIFIDQPVKTYSSGMYVRLAFAVAINVDPDILVVDEALAVGDEVFQRKCFARIEDIKDKGGTILFVSHGAQTIVQLCDRAILMDGGEAIMDGRPKTVVGQYQRLVNLSGAAAASVRERIKAMDGWAGEAPIASKAEPGPVTAPAAEESGQGSEETAWFDPGVVSHSRVEYESKGARIRDVKISTLDGRPVNNLQFAGKYTVTYAIDFSEPVSRAIFGMQVKTVQGFVLTGANNAANSIARPMMRSGDTIHIRFQFTCRLLPGAYLLDVGLMGDDGFSHRILDAAMFRVMSVGNQRSVGYFDLEPELTFGVEADVA